MRVLIIALCVALAYADPLGEFEPVDLSQSEEVEEVEDVVYDERAVKGDCGKNKYNNYKGSFDTDTSPWIVGGKDARAQEFPYQVSLQKSGHYCGGSIINKNWVLTAAHCLKESASSYKVVAGMHKRSGSTSYQKTYKVSKIIKHSSYSSSTKKNDIGLVKISGSFSYNDGIQPICLPKSNYGTDGKTGWTTGWGATSSGGSSAKTLQKVKVPIITNKQCSNAYGSGKIFSSTICAGDLKSGGVDACQGDSGGPLMHLNGNGSMIQVGITSWGKGCAEKKYPGVYTRVSSYVSWIWSNAK